MLCTRNKAVALLCVSLLMPALHGMDVDEDPTPKTPPKPRHEQRIVSTTQPQAIPQLQLPTSCINDNDGRGNPLSPNNLSSPLHERRDSKEAEKLHLLGLTAADVAAQQIQRLTTDDAPTK